MCITCGGNQHDTRDRHVMSCLSVDGISLLNMVATEKILDAEPKDMNFAVFGTLSLTFAGGSAIICDDFRLGQGHVIFTNNW